MNKIYTYLSLLVGLLALSANATAQCAQIVASPASASCNVSYNFNVTGNLFGTTFDFNSGVLPAGWDASPYTVGTPCRTNMNDNSPYFWATTLKGGVRYVRTNPLNVSNGGNIEFFMRYGSDDPGNGCEDPDLTVEGVYLQFSTNGGSSWQTITNWTPLSGYRGPLYQWNRYSYAIPAAAQTGNTIFRWYQPQNSGDMWDNWGLDNIEVAAASQASFAWDFGDGSTSTAQNPSHSYTTPGTYTVTLQVTSPNCNTTVSTQVVIDPGPSLVANLTHPSCPSNNDGQIAAEFQNATQPVTYSWTPAAIGSTPVVSNLGEGAYDLFVTDANGCNASATYQLVSQGSVAPVALAKDLSVSLNNSGSVTISAADVDNGSYSGCGAIASIEIDQTAFDCSNLGDNSVTLTVTDVYGNASTAVSIVTVSDVTAPVAVAQDLTVALDQTGVASITAAAVGAGSSDNCSVASLSLDKTDFSCANVGVNEVILTATDASGNISTATATITVVDQTAPVILTQDITVQLDANGQATITAADVDAGTADACGIASLEVVPTSFNCGNVGENTVIFTVVDVNGNSSVGQAIVKIVDEVAPVILTQDITVQLDANGKATITAADVDAGTADACGIATLEVVPASFNCGNIGENTVMFTAVDVNGNSSVGQAVVKVVDEVAPVVVATDFEIMLDANGLATIAVADIDGGSYDNCGIASLTLSRTEFDCSRVGINIVELTATDNSGNSATGVAYVNVVDQIAPTVITKNITVELDANGEVQIAAADVDAGTFDNCAIASLDVSPALFACAEAGDNVVTLVAADVNGNIASADAVVTVVDVTAPEVLTQDIEVFLDAAGYASITVADIDAGSSDICGIVSMDLSQTEFSCADLGTVEVILTATDEAGNTASAVASVEVIDNIAPVFTSLPVDQTVVATPDDCDPQLFWDLPLVDEACAFQLTATYNSGDEFPVGTTPVTFTATDVSGNSVMHTIQLTVEAQPFVVEIASVSEYAGGYNISCAGLADGSASVSVDGGCLPYTYAWSDGQTAATAGNLVAGSYDVTVADANGSETVLSVTLIEPAVLEADLSSPSVISGYNTSCDVDGDGSAVLSAQGGVQPYAVAWSNGEADVDVINGLNAGDYSVVVTDANGCVAEAAIVLNEPEACNCYPPVPAPPVTCAACTKVIDDMNWVNIGADEVACITTTYNSGVNFSQGTLVICGTADLQGLNLGAGDSVIVLGTLNVGGININSQLAVFENYGTVNVTGWSNLNGTITNYGQMTISQGMNINQDGAFVNNGQVEITASFNLNGSIVNNGYFAIPGTVYANSNADLVNNCTFDIGAITINTTRTFQNNGTFTASQNLVLNNTLSYFGAGSITDLANFTENGAQLNNTGTGCSLIDVDGQTTLNGGVADGPIAICDADGIEADNNIYLTNGASFGCDECIFSPAAGIKSYTEAVAEDASAGEPAIAEQAELSIYPQPVEATDEFTVSFSNGGFELNVYTSLGTLLYTAKGESEITLPASQFGSGSYLIKIVGNDGSALEQFILIK